MRNQTSFRLTTTLLPTDLTAKTTQVINKVDANGDKFYPTFTEETVVITNDDRTIMETTKATCTAGVLTFVKRGLSDDDSETQVTNRKLTRNPGSLCFITAGASDLLDKDDDIVWGGKQIYTDDMESRGKATYKGRLITEKGVEYPHFDTLADLEAYNAPFGGMFAVVDASGELYRYNAVSEEWSVITTNTPTLPEQADDDTIGSVRVATDAEFTAGTSTGSQGEYLMPTVAQVKSNTPSMSLHVVNVNLSSASISTKGESATVTYTVPRDGRIQYLWNEQVLNGLPANVMRVDYENTTCTVLDAIPRIRKMNSGASSINFRDYRYGYLAVSAGTLVLEMYINTDSGLNQSDILSASVVIEKFFYYG